MEKTFSMVQRALNFVEDQSFMIPPRPPLSDAEFRGFLDSVGQIVRPNELRRVIYTGGIDSSLRRVVWKHILNVYPEGMTGRERMDYMKRKASEYYQLRDKWREAVQRGNVAGELAYVTSMVRKDVLRTDRLHSFYAGNDDNQNIASLFNILTTYALNHPLVSYCQGMSDIASPLLVTMADEAQAYICFCAIMRRLNTNFMLDGIAMTQKFAHLSEALLFYDPEFYDYLKSQQADDLLFCYRWLLLEMKREFAFEDSLHMLEVLWSSLPSNPPVEELKLFDKEFQLETDSVELKPPKSPGLLSRSPRESQYIKICELRRQSSAASLHSKAVTINGDNGHTGNDVLRRSNLSLDESISRSNRPNVIVKSHQSMDEAKMKEILAQTNGYGDQKEHSSVIQLTKPNSLAEEKSEEHSDGNDKSPEESNTVAVSSPEDSNNSPCAQYQRRLGQLHNKTTSFSRQISNSGGTHFKELKEKLLASKNDIMNSFDDPNSTKSQKVVKNFNEFLNFAATNKSKLSEKISMTNSKISSAISTTTNELNGDKSVIKSEKLIGGTKNNLNLLLSTGEHQIEGASPDDPQDYVPMTTSITRELRLEIENLDRQVFGMTLNNSDGGNIPYHKLPSSTSDDLVESETQNDTVIIDRTPNGNGDVFIWENPLSELTSPSEIPNLKGNAIKINDNQGQPKNKLKVANEKTSSIDSESQFLAGNWNERDHTNPFLRDINQFEYEEMMKSACEMSTSYEEAAEATTIEANNQPKDCLPPPNEFGGGNPFLMFLCLTLLLQHRNYVIKSNMDYNEMAMHFDKMVRKHNVTRVLNQARKMYGEYLKAHSMKQMTTENQKKTLNRISFE